MNINNDSTAMPSRPGLLSRIFNRKVFQRLGFVLLALVTLAVLAYNFEAWRGRRVLAAFIKEYEAKGERFDRDSVIPHAVPDEQNFACIPVMKLLSFKKTDGIASTNSRTPLNLERQDSIPLPGVSFWMRGNFNNLGDWQDYFRSPVKVAEPFIRKTVVYSEKNTTAIIEFPKSPQPQTPAKDVLLALSLYETEFKQLENASSLSYVRYPLPYEQTNPYAFLDDIMPHLSQLKGIQRTLVLRSSALLADGLTQRAFTNTLAALKVTDGLAAEPLLISLLVRIALESMVIQPVWEGIASHSWSEAQLSAFQDMFEKTDMSAHYRLAMRGERNLLAAAMPGLGWPVKTSSEAAPSADETSLPSLPKAMAYHSQAWMFRMCQVLLEFEPGKTEENNRRIDRFLDSIGGYNIYAILAKNQVSAMKKAMEKVQLIQVCIDQAVIACALERYRLAHGNYPEILDALAPEFVAKIPLDLMTGRQMIYRRAEGNGAILYSVGEDGKDDGGRMRPVKQPGNKSSKTENYDWVWIIPGK